jgi:putative spermidine/putrescine transport system permease protein
METLVPHRRRIWLYALAILEIVYLVAPLAIVVPMSFSQSRFLSFPPVHWSTQWYGHFFQSIDWVSAMIVSLKVGIVTAVASVPIGVAAAYAIHNGGHPIFRRLHAVLLLPLIVPNMIIAIGVFYVYVKLGWLGTFYGLVFADLMLAVPFVVVTTLSGLRSFDMSQELVARSLGSSRLHAFLTITLPQIKPSVLTGLLFAFITALDEVIIAIFISGGDNLTLTKVMFDTLHDEIDPTIAAVSSLLIGGSLIVAGLALLLARLGSPRKGRASDAGAAEVQS